MKHHPEIIYTPQFTPAPAVTTGTAMLPGCAVCDWLTAGWMQAAPEDREAFRKAIELHIEVEHTEMLIEHEVRE